LKKNPKKYLKIFFIVLMAIVVFAAMMLSSCKLATATTETTQTEQESGETSAAEETGQSTEETAVETEETASSEEITGEINPLSGLALSDKILNLRPLAIMVENTPDARPQSGMTSADVVFEVVDEHGITRFVTVFSSYSPEMIGPVRSARPYYAEIAASFDPIYVFWGTHPTFYITIEKLGLDYLSPNGDTSGASSITSNFVDPWEAGENQDAIRDGTRQRPHNAYVRPERMREIAEELGYKTDWGQSPFHFKNEAPEGDRGDISDITIDISSTSYKVNFLYDSQTNTYLRSCGGQPSTDRETGKQVTVNNVIVLFTDIRESGDAEGHMIVRTTQGGDALYFLDGKVVEGTWGRTSALDSFELKDASGNNMLVNIGQTWVLMVQNVGMVDY